MTTTRLCDLDDIEPCSAIRVDIDGHRLAVIRMDDDTVYVIGDRCTHADISLAEGEVDCDEGTIECWKHGSVFGVDDGVPRTLPATKATPTYVARVVDGAVVVEIEATEDEVAS